MTARRAVLAIAATLVALAAAPAPSQAAGPCGPPVTNPVACENSKPGTPRGTWDIFNAGDDTIQGYATAMSVNPGTTVTFKIKTPASSYHFDVYRIGYYGGDGARLMASGVRPTATLPQTQPACLTDSSTGLIDCGNWNVSASWAVPSTAVSGVYIAKLIRDDNGAASHITFVVRDDSSHSAVVLQTSDETWQAYNTYGGNSLYKCTVACPPGEPKTYKAAYAVSYNRPFNTADDDGGRSWLFSGAEYSMIRFVERNGYDVSYTTNVDTHRRGTLLANHKLFISSGHDEYWSQTQRDNVEAARDTAGLNLAFFTGNEMYWKTRWAPSADGTNTPDRTVISYKDTHFDAQVDPVEPTGTWRDPRFRAQGGQPENGLTGQSFLVNLGSAAITVPAAYKDLRLWKNTAVASLSSGQSVQLAPQTLGYEWDEDVDNGFRPAGQFRLSSTTVSGLEVFTDFGSTTTLGGTATHNLTQYRVPSGARVFGSGTVQWSWGLDSDNPNDNPEDRNMQQATVNLFADMKAQPGTLMSGLVAANASTDSTAPTSSISSPAAGANVADGSKITVSGVASDSGGVVAGVEVSTDGGSTWHPATGTTSWSYTWVAHGNPRTTLRTRAVDDSGNLETPAAGRQVDVGCPCSLWGDNVTPGTPDSGDPNPAEVGIKFKSDTYGSITGIRFFKAAANTGTHTGSLWSASGERLAQATFAGESASGWQTATFSTPVQVVPGTTYVASYFAPAGHFAITPAYLFPAPAPGPQGGATTDSAPLHALRNSGATTNGVYAYSGTSTFPIDSYNATNYWVDVRFTPTPAPGQVTGVSAVAAGRTSAGVSWTAPSTGGAPTSYKVTPYVGASAQASKTITGSPPATSTAMTGLTQGTTYTFKVEAINPSGSGPASAASNPVTPLAPVVPTAPTAVQASGASNSARVSWTPPDSDGDSPITAYTVTPYLGAAAQNPAQVAGSATSTTITGLTNGASYTFRVTATNAPGDSPASAPSNAVTPQLTLFDFATPTQPDSGDGSAVELGVKFRADESGSVTGVRFYKADTNTGTHVGSLWSTGGQRLAQATFTNETASGWQTATFATPVDITAGTTYIASYFAPKGHYSALGSAFSPNGVDNPPLRALSNGTSANGVYMYTAASTFPVNSYNATNYWVDVTFSIPPPGPVVGVSAAEAGQASASVTWTAPAAGGKPTAYRITPYVGSTAQPATTISGTPPATNATVGGLTTGTTYTFKVAGVNSSGTGPQSAASNAVTPQAPVAPSAPSGVVARPATRSARVSWTPPTSDGDSPITGYTVTPYDGTTAQDPVDVSGSTTSTTITGLTNGTSYTFRVKATNAAGTSLASQPSDAVTPRITILDFSAPSVADAGDGNAVELGVKFRADVSGTVTGVRFYKADANTGTHVGSLWTAAGQRLAQATFTNETASGWQTATFATPVDITADTTYVASYHAPNGHYSGTSSAFSPNGLDNPPLHALANSTSPNGVYGYTSTGGFPGSSWNATNYWVDVLFASAPLPGTPSGVSATAGLASASVDWTAPTAGGAASAYKITPFIGSNAQTATTITGAPPATTATIRDLAPGTAYTFKVQASNLEGPGPQSAASNAVTPLAPQPPGAPTGVTAQADTKSAQVNWNAPSNDGGSAITGYTITPYQGATAQDPVQTSGASTSARVSGLTNGTSYTFSVKARNANGTGSESAASGAVAPLNSIFDFGSPSVADAGDGNAVELGVKFRVDVSGTVNGVRFYKASANTGTHVGSLWTTAGQRLAQATFANESTSGWQTATFATPVSVTADTTYVVSYHAPNGHYSVTGSAFSPSGVDNAPLHALADSVSPSGVYLYTGAGGFPTNSWNATNYWVDVLFAH